MKSNEACLCAGVQTICHVFVGVLSYRLFCKYKLGCLALPVFILVNPDVALGPILSLDRREPFRSEALSTNREYRVDCRVLYSKYYSFCVLSHSAAYPDVCLPPTHLPCAHRDSAQGGGDSD